MIFQCFRLISWTDLPLCNLFCTMKICRKSPYILLKLIHITLFPALEAQKVETWYEVTGYVERDVTLPCPFIQGPDIHITQFEWDFNPPEGEKITIIVSSSQYGVVTHNTSLKERVDLTGQSLIIKNVKKTDAGSYICSVSTFPNGAFKGTTKLFVQEQMPLSSGVIAAVVIAIMLLLVIMAATVYHISMRRCNSVVRNRVYIDKDGPVIDVARLSVIRRDEDVVYSDIKFKSSREVTPLSNDKHTETMHADDVTYSEVVILCQQPK
ncbi:uncharacterized protein LOC122987339 [Thunnus albacares]|uniref:uncharacterized protein LOC122987339 n=1 Tax=Thunnus albacares TaxID=8236 RepID=UPI001CF6D82C|nr:uncharacterized protein LOC122987339 [Thunnus albacares]